MQIHGYFDYAASCPPFPEAVGEFARVWAKCHGNPSSQHDAGRAAREQLEATRRDFAALCGFSGGRVILTSGGTESNNMVIRGVLEGNPKGRLLIAADVHASAWFAAERYPDRTDILSVGSDGRIGLQRVADALTPDTVLCSVLHGNNETGILHDVAAIGRFCASKGVLFHCDGVQPLGHVPLLLDEMPVDYYTFSAHKFGGPRGVGGVFRKGEAALSPLIAGGGQERGLKAGTENVAGFAAAHTALELSAARMASEIPRLRSLARILIDAVQRSRPETIVNSDLEGGLPGLVSLSLPGVMGSSVVTEMDLLGFALSSGSACHSGDVRPSRVILAMGRTEPEALGTIRVSMGRDTNEEQALNLATTLAEVVDRQRALS